MLRDPQAPKVCKVFKDLSAQLDKQLQRLDGIVKDDLATFNQQLAKKRVEPVVVK